MIAFTNGCFDLFHAGHRAVLSFASTLAPKLVVAINDDHWVRAHKGPNRPVNPIDVREANVERYLESLRIAWQIVIFESESQLAELVRSFAKIDGPLVLVKGEQYRGQELTGSRFASRIEYAPMVPGVSTTAILEGKQGWIDTTNWAEI